MRKLLSPPALRWHRRENAIGYLAAYFFLIGADLRSRLGPIYGGRPHFRSSGVTRKHPIYKEHKCIARHDSPSREYKSPGPHLRAPPHAIADLISILSNTIWKVARRGKSPTWPVTRSLLSSMADDADRRLFSALKQRGAGRSNLGLAIH